MLFNEINKLAGSMNDKLVTPELFKPNDYYGHAVLFKNYCGLNYEYKLKSVVSHGLSLKDNMWELEKKAELPCYICFSNVRLRTVSKYSNKAGFAIGPYIHYAEGILNENQLSILKKTIGKTLLVFPSHSTHWIDVHFDIDQFINTIKRYATEFQTVICCLYWKDVLRGFAKKYIEQGFLCTTAGHIYQNLFLKRLRSIIEISDYVISNSIGTHLFYSSYLAKPYFYVDQSKEFITTKQGIPGPHNKDRPSKLILDLKKTFSKYDNKISSKKMELVSSVGGFDQIKTPEELRNVFMIAEDMYQRGKQFFMNSGNVHLDQLDHYILNKKQDKAGVLLSQAKALWPSEPRVVDAYKYLQNGVSFATKIDENKINIDQDDVEWIGVRFLDTVSRAFRYKDKHYKAIFPGYEKHILNLYRNGIFDHLFDCGMVPETTVSGYCIDDFNLVLEQNTECFNFKSQFWNPYMLRDAALKCIELNKYLLSKNLILKDGHVSNIIFQENSTPKWCDIGSIVPGNNESMAGVREFIQYFVYPLMIRGKSSSLSRISRYFSVYGCTEEEATQILKQNIRFDSGRRQVLDDLELVIHNINIKFDKTTWSDYHGDLSQKDLDLYEKKKGISGVNRNEIVKRFLRTFKPKTVLDIGANAGMFSILAAQSGAEVLALEPDESASVKCYQNFRNQDGMKVKVSMDSFGAKTNHIPDLAIGMALTHHLFFTHKYRLEIIAKILSKHTNNALITEFMPNGMGGHVPKPYPLPENYRLELFLEELSKYFEKVETIDPPRSATSSHRVIIICHNKLSELYETS